MSDLFYLTVFGVTLQLVILFWRPIYQLVKSRESDFQKVLLAVVAIRLAWAGYAYWCIWNDFHHPDQWVKGSSGFTLAIYSAIFPLLVLVFDRLAVKLIGVGCMLFSKRKGVST